MINLLFTLFKLYLIKLNSYFFILKIFFYPFFTSKGSNKWLYDYVCYFIFTIEYNLSKLQNFERD